jgi:RHS repeat-associated protein
MTTSRITYNSSHTAASVFTAHTCPERSRREMLDEFGIIDMPVPNNEVASGNGRIYCLSRTCFGNPVIARFFSPDPFVQAADFSQSYNRYSYVMNNPLVYTDPSGEFFGSIFTAIWDFGTTAFTKGGLEFWNWRSDYVQNAWRDFDPSGSWSKTNKAWRIDVGLLKTDPNRTLVGRGLQFASRFLWEMPQTVLGNVVSHARNISVNVDNVSYYGGATLVNNDDPTDRERWGLTLGPYINSKNVVADPFVDDLFRHEYGHTLQSMLVGPLYLTNVAIPSLISATLDYELDWFNHNHDRSWFETQANRMAFRYFSNHEPNSLVFNPTTNRGLAWDNAEYPRNYNPTWFWLFSPPFPLWLLF